ncbi:MAG: asparagine synthetase B, partial [Kordiimonadaceae bacterium]|nr:asparagine synthetase B [Kordiimonadaceae bacterium]
MDNGEKVLKCMGELLAHRGPDGEGTWMDDSGKVGLSHRRLAIIDLTPSGAQPMKGRDGTLITLNGEIYNYLELQESLSGSWDFSSESDTETVLAAYDKYGEDCVDHLRGMFSFAIWDDRKQ